jgi:putative hydrolase of the HAD superfamily
MIQAVFFDLDGTLYDRDEAILRMIEEQFDAFREELGNIEKFDFVERLVDLDGRGHDRKPQLHHILTAEFGLGSDLADRLEIYFRAHYPRHCRVSADTLTTLDTLRAHHKKLGIITNGPTKWQSRKIESMGIRSFFDSILISETEEIQKPDSRIFARALDRCGVIASESMFVGDHPRADIAGARAAGLLAVWKRMPYWEVPSDVQRINQLSEILPLILDEYSGYEVTIEAGK